MNYNCMIAPGSLSTRYFEQEFVEVLRDADLVFAVPNQQPGSPYLLYPAGEKTQEPLGHARTAQVLYVPIDLLTDDLYALVSACLKIKGECFFQPTSREFKIFFDHEYRSAVQSEAGRYGVKDRRGGRSLSIPLALKDGPISSHHFGD